MTSEWQLWLLNRRFLLIEPFLQNLRNASPENFMKSVQITTIHCINEVTRARTNRPTDRRTDRQTTVTLSRMCRGLIVIVIIIMLTSNRIVKLSSPNLNYLIIIGAMFMYLSVYFHLMPVTSANAVQARCIVRYCYIIICILATD